MKYKIDDFRRDMDKLEKLDKRARVIWDYVGIEEEVGKLIVDMLSYNIDLIKKKYNDTDWIEWWIYECDYGRREMAVIVNDEEIKPKTVEDLWKIMGS